ncbi:MAG: TonB-dependent receptor, partial [Gemmatimonadaceae bacterium]
MTPLRSSRVPVLVALLALAAPVAAQVGRDTLSLPALVVTATRVPGGIKTQTSTVTVLDGERLRAEGITHLGDALRRVPGLAVVRQSSFGSQSSLYLRGGQSNYVRLLVDGVPVNEPGGTLDLGRITLDDIERIEVVRGPASVLYGSDAVTGVIQLFTRTGDGATRVNAELGGGSFGARNATLGASARSGGLAWALSGAHHASDGTLAFNNAYRNDGLSASVALPADADRRTDARLSARYHASVYEYPTESDGTVGDRNAERTEHRAQAAIDAGHKWSDRLETRVQLSLSELHPRTTDGPDDAADTLGFYGYL